MAPDRWWEHEAPRQCDATHYTQIEPNNWVEVRCRKPDGHDGLHMSDPLYPIGILEVTSW